MEEQVQAFLDYLIVEKSYSANTIAAYRNDLTQFLRFITTPGLLPPEPQWSDVRRNHLIQYQLFLHEQRYAPSTIARKIAAIKSFFQFILAAGVITEDPAASLDSPKVKKQPPKAIPEAQIEMLLAEPAKDHSPKGLRDRALMELLYATGMRVTEVVSLDLTDVNLATGTVRCVGKGDRERVLPINASALEALRAYLDHGRPNLGVSDEERALFVNHRGHRLTRQGLWLILKRYVQAIGMDDGVTPYTLRHSFAAHMLSKGAALREVQHRLGHASISTTQAYTTLMHEGDHDSDLNST